MSKYTNSMTKVAGENIPAFRLVKISSSDETKVVIASGSDKNIIAVSKDNCPANDYVPLEILGVSNETIQVEASGGITAGSKVVADANGKIKQMPTAIATEQTVQCVGTVLTPSFADGNIVELAHASPYAITIPANT